MSQPTVDSFMTPNPVTIAPDRTLASAKLTMRDKGLRHLPVVEDGNVVGILSEREVDLITAIAEVPADEICVRRAMIANVLQVTPGDPLADVAQRMSAAKCGSAVVMEESEVRGIFTTTDALAALAHLIESEAPSPAD